MSTVNRAATITAAGVTSNAIDLGGLAIVGMILPATFTSTAVTFTASDKIDGTYNAVYKIDGNAYTVTLANSRYVVIPPADLCGIQYLKVIPGTSEAADRDIILMLRTV